MKESMLNCIDQIPSQYAPEKDFKIVSVILFKAFLNCYTSNKLFY